MGLSGLPLGGRPRAFGTSAMTGGGAGGEAGGGGGGAGGYLTSTLSTAINNAYTITVGAGGAQSGVLGIFSPFLYGEMDPIPSFGLFLFYILVEESRSVQMNNLIPFQIILF